MHTEASKARGFAVSEARPEDIDAIVALERAIEHAPHWPRHIYMEMVQSAASGAEPALCRRLILAKNDEGLVIGFAVGSMPLALEDSAVLESVAVALGMRGSGVGRALCEAVIEWCRSNGAAGIGLEVRSRSEGAIRLYGRLGFTEIGERPGYYNDPPDGARILRMPLMRS